MPFQQLDKNFIELMRRWGVDLLRVALGIVFLWFGLLKIFDLSPVVSLVAGIYSFLPTPFFIKFLGWWETAIGVGLILKFWPRIILGLLWLQLLGTFMAVVLAPEMFFTGGNIFLLTLEGEFVIKNIVFVASGIVIGGHLIKSRNDK